MSLHVSSWAWRQFVGDPAAKIVLLKLADVANDEGECWPSQRYLAEECEMSDRNVRFKIQKLEQLGLIQVKRTKREDGGWNVNVYRLPIGTLLPMPQENQRKPTSSYTSLEPKKDLRKPTSYGVPADPDVLEPVDINDVRAWKRTA